jgi:prephenate dehydrogenase
VSDAVHSEVRSVAVIGLGLIGGSLARDLAAHGVDVSAYDRSADDLRSAIEAGVVARALRPDLSDIGDVDVVVLAVPVDSAIDLLGLAARATPSRTLITDVGSTKAGIVAAATVLGVGDRFIGAHPMAGDHRSGWRASRRGLFVDACVYLCHANESQSDLINFAERFWQSVGGRPYVLRAEEHDRKLAWTSHLPHVMATALGSALAGAGVTREELGPGGRDMTRLAGSSPEMWTAIAQENAVAIDAALAAAEGELARFRAALATGDRQALSSRFATARAWFDR